MSSKPATGTRASDDQFDFMVDMPLVGAAVGAGGEEVRWMTPSSATSHDAGDIRGETMVCRTMA